MQLSTTEISIKKWCANIFMNANKYTKYNSKIAQQQISNKTVCFYYMIVLSL